MLGWSQEKLAKESGINKRTIMEFEGDKSNPMTSTVRNLQATMEAAGIRFVAKNGGGAGVRWTDPEREQ